MTRVSDAGYALGWAATRHVPARVAQAVFTRIADEAWRRRGRGVQRLEQNLRRVRPDADAEEIRLLAREGMRSYLRYWCEVFRLPVWSPEQVVGSVLASDEHLLRDAHAAGRGVVVALPHMANWDHAGAWACLTGMPLTTVAERLEPEQLFRRFVEYREGLGMEVLPLTGGGDPFRLLADRLRGGRLVCLVADRDLSSTGVQVDLLGEPASLPVGPAALARTTGAPLLPATLAYDGPWLRIRIHPAIEPLAGPSGLRGMTQQLADAFSAGIREAPQDWHMLQRVFTADLR